MAENNAPAASGTSSPRPAAAPAATSTPRPAAPAASSTGAPSFPKFSATSFKHEGRRVAALADAGTPETVAAAEEHAPVEEQTPIEATEIEEAPVEEAAPEEGAEVEAAPAEAEMIAGVPVDEILAALREGKLPDALWDALQDELVDGDEREMRPLRDFRDGAMMHRNFTKKSMALAAERREHAAAQQQFDARQQEFYGMVQGWKDPKNAKNFLRTAKSLELPIDEIVYAWAEDVERRGKLTPEQQQAELSIEQNRAALEKEARELRAQKAKLQELEGAGKNAESEKHFQQFRTFIVNTTPEAFAAVGIANPLTAGDTPEQQNINKLIRSRFQEVLGVYWTENSQPTKEMIYHAARATAELLGIKKSALAPQAAQPKAAAPVARPAAPKAARPLTGAASYDPGKNASPARKQVSARTLQQQLTNASRGRK